ncbi:MAG TPA: gamma-glutamylcyclotransferase [Alphaproteobacteria bacterium]|nr:gamma-glutamylcyclotransferase [Alphaproteobacteria bacterium]
MAQRGDLWIFGYGSLMWDPGFAYIEREPALLRGYHRAFCIYSHRYRGTAEAPGLVLGLQPGGSCRGIAYRIASARRAEVFAYLDEREMSGNVYEQRPVPVVLVGRHRRVHAYAHITKLGHPQHTGPLAFERIAELICQGHGTRGACAEYLVNTVRHLDELGIKDGPMHELLRYVEGRRASRPASSKCL